jgi:hypothetical protein
VWLKWALFRNSMRSRKAVVGRVAAAVGMLAGFVLALMVAAGLGGAAYFFALAGAGGRGDGAARDGFILMFFIFTMMFMMWGMMPLLLGGGSRFEPGRLLLYPVSLRKLFLFDFVSDLSSLTSVFAVPSALAMGLGAGLASGRVAAGLSISVCAVAFGMSFSKLLSAGVGALMKSRRTRGEMLLALLGAALGMTGALMGQLMPLMERYGAYLEGARWSPPGAAAYALSRGMKPGGALAFAASLATLAAYALVCFLASYWLARRTALGAGGSVSKRKTAAKAAQDATKAEQYAGWQVPFASPQFSAVVEKEIRYALRNAQLRVIALMAVGLTIVLRLAPMNGGMRRSWSQISQYAEGSGAVFSVLYIFMLVSPLSTNLFGYDGAGMRALVLSPVSRRVVLTAKNAATTFISLLLVTVGVFGGGIVFGDLTPRTLLFIVLVFVTTAGLFPVFGNWLSMQFPKRVEFGKRMNRSGLAGFLLVPFFLLLTVPPAVAVLAAHIAQSLAVKYVILAAFAVLSIGFYLLLLPLQARTLERRELEILEAVTGRGEGGDSQIMG